MELPETGSEFTSELSEGARASPTAPWRSMTEERVCDSEPLSWVVKGESMERFVSAGETRVSQGIWGNVALPDRYETDEGSRREPRPGEKERSDSARSLP